jgi:hypothetical protein
MDGITYWSIVVVIEPPQAGRLVNLWTAVFSLFSAEADSPEEVARR